MQPSYAASWPEPTNHERWAAALWAWYHAWNDNFDRSLPGFEGRGGEYVPWPEHCIKSTVNAVKEAKYVDHVRRRNGIPDDIWFRARFEVNQSRNEGWTVARLREVYARELQDLGL